MAVVLGSGCGTTAHTIDTAEQIVQNAIDVVDKQPSAWQETLQNTIDELRQAGTDLTAAVQDVLSQATADVFCVADFIGRRVKEQLQQLAHMIDAGRPAPQVVPVICHTEPSDKIDAGTTKLVTVLGYNFLDFGRNGSFSGQLRYADGEIINPTFGHTFVVNDYKVGVEFQTADFANLDPRRGPQLELTWQSSSVRSDVPGVSSILPIILPPPPRHEDFTVSVHANPGDLVHPAGYCVRINQSYRIEGGWKIDRSKGDPGHSGISLIDTHRNEQAKRTLREDNYQSESDDSVRVTGVICGDSWPGPGATLNDIYRVYAVRR